MILHDLISYDVLRVIWWLLLGLLLIFFTMTDGFDLGTATLLPFVGKTDAERRVVINTIGPVWEGNQVWFILGGGAIFAAWPPLYAASFSGFYLAMFVILASLILRPVGFKYRSKRDGVKWRRNWDWALFVGGTVPALLFGVAIGNVLLGVPFELNADLHLSFAGPWWYKFVILLRPFALLCGVVSLAMCVTHGASWLMLKTEGDVQLRARRYGAVAGVITMVGFALAGLWLAVGIDGYHLAAPHVPNGPSNPLMSEVVHGGSWLSAYGERPWIAIAPILGFLGMAMAVRGLRKGNEGSTILWSKLGILGVISTVGLTMFPMIMPSNISPDSSLTVWDASSSHLTLFIMLVAGVIFLPIIIAYTSWVYKVLWGKVTEEEVVTSESAY